MRMKTYFNHLGYWQRIKIFLKTKKKRFFYLFAFFIAFNFIGNFCGFFVARLERSARKYKKLGIMKYNPSLMTYQSAVDTLYEPLKMSSSSADKITETFLRLDRILKDGMSRLLIIQAFKKCGLLADVEEERKFLKESGF